MSKVVVSTRKRDYVPRSKGRDNNISPSSLERTVSNWLSSNNDHYLGFGGIGDSVLLLAATWNNSNARVVFFANSGSSEFIKSLFKVFNNDLLILPNIMGSSLANKIHNMFLANRKFKTSAHLADGLYHEDWRNQEKYLQRIINSTPWLDVLGKKVHDKKSVVICPTGSSRDMARQRFITRQEYTRLVKKYLNKNWVVFVTGAERDMSFYPLVDENCYWLSKNGVLEFNGKKTGITIRDMLQIINGADEIISVDTWLKTYTLLVGLPTTMILTRWNGRYKDFGIDTTDWVFSNKAIWPKLVTATVEDVIA